MVQFLLLLLVLLLLVLCSRNHTFKLDMALLDRVGTVTIIKRTSRILNKDQYPTQLSNNRFSNNRFNNNLFSNNLSSSNYTNGNRHLH